MTICGIKNADGVCVMGECPYIKKCCPVVWDKSKAPTTNEEYIKALDTEQLAEVLNKIFMTRTFCHICPEGNVCDIGYECKYDGGKVNDWVEWLKQPHKE